MPNCNASGMPPCPRPAVRPYPQRDVSPELSRRRDCGDTAVPASCSLADYPVAMAYVPWQHFHTTCELDRAFATGTIFPELDKPFLGKRGCRA